MANLSSMYTVVKPHAFRSKDMSSTYTFEEEGMLTFDRTLVNVSAKVGSATIPGLRGNDLDIALQTDFIHTTRDLLGIYEGWHLTGSHLDYQQSCVAGCHPFYTARKGVYNLIMFEDMEGYQAYVEANDLCVRLGITDRIERIHVFDAVTGKRYGN
jgi:hypothetical protein